MAKTVNRKLAIKNGKEFYLSNKLCVRGHRCFRRVKDGNCVKCAKIRFRKYRGLPEPTRTEPIRCECCHRISNRALHLDHDHLTGLFRGWLCHQCNLGIGKLGDTVESVMNAIHYLNRHYERKDNEGTS